MASKTVVICDSCGIQESPDNKIVLNESTVRELCFNCAYSELRTMYGVPQTAPSILIPVDVTKEKPPVEPELSADTQAFLKRRGELQTALETMEIYVVKPKVPVATGTVIEYGNPPRNVEIIEDYEGHPGEFWAKIVGAIT